MSKRKIYKNYSYELKLEAVQAVLSGENIQIIAKRFEVTDPDYIYVWIEKYKTYGEFKLKRKIRNHPTLDQDYVIKELQKENDILKKYLKLRRREEKDQSLNVVQELRSKYPITKICTTLKVSRAGYYKFLGTNKNKKKGNKRKNGVKRVYNINLL